MAAKVPQETFDDFQKVAKKQDAGGKTGQKDKAVYAIFYVKDQKEIVTEKIDYGTNYANTESAAELANFKDEKGGVFARFRADMEKYNIKGNVGPPSNHASPVPRYAALDVHMKSKDGTAITSKLILIRFSPDTAGVQAKMIASQSEGNFKARMNLAKIWQVTDFSQFTYDECVTYAYSA
jgi:hypothetical protein